MRTIITSTKREGAREERTFETQQPGIGQLKPRLLALFVAGLLALLITSPALAQNFALAGYDSNGNLDTNFGGNGKVTTSFSNSTSNIATAVAVDSASRVVVAGIGKNTGTFTKFALARYKTDGSLDTTFGNGDGMVLTGFLNAHAYASAVAIDQQGRIVVAGYTETYDPSYTIAFALARYNPDGSLDLSFSNDGKVQTSFSSSFLHCRANAVAIDYAGRIVAAGTAYANGYGNAYSDADSAFVLARYKSDGSLDPTFNNDGRVITNSVGAPNSYDREEINDIKIDLWGRIVGAGMVYKVDSSYHHSSVFAVLRYHESGYLDTSFNGGIAYPHFGDGLDAANAVTIDQSGKIVVAGHAWGGTNNHFALARLNPDGTLDQSFSSDGKVITIFPRRPSEAMAVMIDGNGKILAAGEVSGTGAGGFALARYNADGSLDNTLTGGDYNGLVTTDFSCSVTQTSESAYGMAIQYVHGIPRIILAGYTHGDPCW